MPMKSRTPLIALLLAVLVGLTVMLLATRLPLYLRIQTAPTVPSTLTKQFTWTPGANFPPGTYVAQIVAEDDHGGRVTKDVEIVVTGEAPGEAIPGDLNRDSVVNIDDLTLVTSNFGRATAEATDPRADANADGLVNIDDLTIVTSNFGRTADGGTPPDDPRTRALRIIDTNRDQILTAEEWQAAVTEFTRLLTQSGPEREYKSDYDMNGDGAIDGLDIDAFTQLFTYLSEEEQVRYRLLQVKAQYAGDDGQLSTAEYQQAIQAFTDFILQASPTYIKLFDINGDGALNNQDIEGLQGLAQFVSE